jgi:hypothetical protein
VSGILAHLDGHFVWTVQGSSAVPMAGTRKGLAELRHFFEKMESIAEVIQTT